MSQMVLSAKTGISQSRIVQYEKDACVPPTKKLHKIAEVLEVTVEWLYFGGLQADNSPHQDELVTVGQRLKLICEERSLSAANISELSGLPEDLILSYLDDTKPILVIHANIIATVLGVNRAWLAFGSK